MGEWVTRLRPFYDYGAVAGTEVKRLKGVQLKAGRCQLIFCAIRLAIARG
jgi:hypothetical protein